MNKWALACFCVLAIVCEGACADSITVDFTRSLGDVNPWILGGGQCGYDPFEIFGVVSIDDYSNYGVGLWNPETRASVPEVIQLMRDRGLSISRFPGGCGAHRYNWKQTIGAIAERQKWQFGVDEFLTTCKNMQAEPLYTLSYFTGGPQDCADLVEYLNASDDGKHPWAAKRAANGHREPYGVVYFEYGNECFHTADHQGLVDPREYVERFTATAKAVKAVDPSVKLGAVAFNGMPSSEWNKIVFEGVKEHVDFIVEHVYAADLNFLEKEPDLSSKEIFECALAAPVHVDQKLRELNTLVKERTGRNDLKLAITEYNATFLGEKPVPYRLSLGTALYNAELLRIFMQPESKVLMANIHSSINEYFGSIKGPLVGAPPDEPRVPNYPKEGYTCRPNYWIQWLYHQHFGQVLLPVKTDCKTYETPGGCGVLPAIGDGRERAEFSSDNLLASNEWLLTDFDGANVKQENGVITLEFSPDVTANYRNALMYVDGVKPNTTYRLSGEVRFSRDIWGIKLSLGDMRGQLDGSPPAATLWPLPNKGIWTRQYADFSTPPDIEKLEVAILRAGKQELLGIEMKVTEPEIDQVRNVEIREVLPEVLPAIPYLSVNASRSADGKTVYLMVVNKNQEESITAPIGVYGFEPKRVRAWVLNGPSIDATNEDISDNVSVSEKPETEVVDGFTFTFEPHSLTALEIGA